MVQLHLSPEVIGVTQCNLAWSNIDTLPICWFTLISSVSFTHNSPPSYSDNSLVVLIS